jgi:hypothetical protein
MHGCRRDTEFKSLHGYVKIKESVADELNRQTRFHAHEFYIVNSNNKKDHWFDPGIGKASVSRLD